MLNAFRHQRMDHNEPNVKGCILFLCAQRLSASTNGSLTRRHYPLLLGFVLNAFRHQRMDHPIIGRAFAKLSTCSTPFGINEWITRCGFSCVPDRLRAQRLSASTNGSQCTSCCGHETRQGAQRLSASTNGSPSQLHSPRMRLRVLNAFRHQRMDHNPLAVDAFADLECSTPFGINEWITHTQNLVFIALVVLNAFRHQRMDHIMIHEGHDIRHECSTPFGINEWITGCRNNCGLCL